MASELPVTYCSVFLSFQIAWICTQRLLVARTAVQETMKHFLFSCSSCLQQLAPCSRVTCEQVVMTCRGWSQATCLSLATGPYRLTAAPRATNQGGGAAAMNWTLHRWVFSFRLIETHPSLCHLSVLQRVIWSCTDSHSFALWISSCSCYLSAVLESHFLFYEFFFCSHNKVMWQSWEGE